jgi:xylulokinase
LSQYLLGIDIGTSGTKTVLFDTSGNMVGTAISEYPLSQPYPGWAEQNPEDWWNATLWTINEVTNKTGVNGKDIKAIGLSGQMHGLVLLDANHQVLRPSIIWCDQRTTQECEQITQRVGKERLIELTANPALTGFTASKILWVRNQEPDIYRQVKKILLPKDYIRFKLTGTFATEVSDASGMQLLDIKHRCWSDEVLDKLQIDKELLADVFESQVVSARVSPEVAQQTGLIDGTPVVGGAGDQAAAAIGNGIVKPGIVSSTIGTSGVVFAYTRRPVIDPGGRVHTFCHAIPDTWQVMGVTQAAGLSLKWFRDTFCDAEKQKALDLGIDVYDLLNQEVDKVPAGAEGLLYLPYLMGERSPHLDPSARGVFFGMSPRHHKEEMLRAVMEGVTYSLKDCLEIIKQMGVTVNEVRASGGGAKSEPWRRMQADIFNTDVVTVNSAEASALGVALLAGVGVGIYSSIEDACDKVIQKTSHVHPNTDNQKVYAGYYRAYRNLYTSLKDNFKELAALTHP